MLIFGERDIFLKQKSLAGRPTTLEQKRFQDFLNNMGLILNWIQDHSAILCLKKELVELWMKEICNQLNMEFL